MPHPSDRDFRFKSKTTPPFSDSSISGKAPTTGEESANAMNQPSPKPKDAPENPWVEAAKTLGLSLLLAFGIRQFVAEPRFIPSESMVPTLEVNDRLIVEKISYLLHPPERGDIIVFSPPAAVAQACNSPATITQEAFIKRVIGLPGDTVEVRNGTVFINKQPLSEPYIAEPPHNPAKPQVVPPNSYFVMGDNRNNSCDSRFWGDVPRSNIIGRAAFRFFPFDRIGGLNP
jgi:signal peptidase I